MKKLLFLAYRFPLPLSGGDRIRMWNDAKMLSEKYELTLLSIVDKEPEKKELTKAKKIFKEIYIFKISRLRSYFNAAFGLFGSLPLQVNYFYDKKIADWIKKNNNKYHTLFCITIRTAQYAKFFNGKKILDLVDAVSLNYERAEIFSKDFFWRLIYKIEIPRLKKYETNAISFFDKVFLVSETDLLYLSQIGADKNKLFHLGLSVELPKIKKIKERENTILYFAKMDYSPNFDGAVFFIDNVFPIIKKKIPDVALTLAGFASEKLRAKIKNKEKIEFRGFVEDLDAVILQSSIIISPVRFGAGTQNKIIHAMSLGKCVVATNLANKSIGAKQGVEIETADNAQEMAEKIIYLLKNPEKRCTIGKNAREFVKNMYAYNKIKKKLLNLSN